ncbi:MAG: hypothetical protein RL701_1832 [Pseudomonadota bacterium]|jgi:hypothetical protein
MFDYIGTELEGQIAQTVAEILQNPSSVSEEAAHRLCEGASEFLQLCLNDHDDWPQGSIVDGIMPLSIEAIEPSESCELQLAGAAIVAHGEHWVVEPVVLVLAARAGALLDFSIVFGDATQEPTAYDDAFDYRELSFPTTAEGWRFEFGSVESDAA